MDKQAIQKIKHHFQEIDKICKKNDIKDITTNGRVKEFLMAVELGHTLADNTRGADAFDENGNPVEYKSTVNPAINAAYRGISCQESWRKQRKYFKEEKIFCCQKHYFARFDGLEIVEMYSLEPSDVFKILIPKLKKEYKNKKENFHKDPRLGVVIFKNEILENGVQLI